MQFTAREMKLIGRLRKQERRWPRTRWILLGMSGFILAGCAYLAQMLFGTLGSETFSPADSALLFALFWPKVILMTAFAGVFIGLVIRDWHGNVHGMLLLRLLDAHQKETGKNENVG